MGRSERRKGVDAERELVRWLNEHGVDAERVPLSGALPTYKGDVLVRTLDSDRPQCWEVKRRRALAIEAWLEGFDAVAMRSDGGEWLVCVRLTALLPLLS